MPIYRTPAIGLFAVTFTVLSTACSSTNPRVTSSNTPKVNDSELVDRNGYKYPVKTLLDSNLWMTANLQTEIAGSYRYENADSNCKKYGRLYTWEAAKQGCSLLGEGWQLPTRDDWQRLTVLYGASRDSTAMRKEAFRTLMYTGLSGFNAVLGGGRSPDEGYKRVEAHGFYWTATEGDSSIASYANFANGSQALYMQNEGEKERAFSVRCMKRMNGSK